MYEKSQSIKEKIREIEVKIGLSLMCQILISLPYPTPLHCIAATKEPLWLHPEQLENKPEVFKTGCVQESPGNLLK